MTAPGDGTIDASAGATASEHRPPDLFAPLDALNPAAARDPAETLREARAYARAILFDDLAVMATPAEWVAARAANASMRLSSDAHGNEYFAHAPAGEPLGVALGMALRVALAAAVGRARHNPDVIRVCSRQCGYWL
jgi:hypothetical protein